MVDIEFIKKKHLQEGWSIRRIARCLAINRITVRKAIAAKEIPRYRLRVCKNIIVTAMQLCYTLRHGEESDRRTLRPDFVDA